MRSALPRRILVLALWIVVGGGMLSAGRATPPKPVADEEPQGIDLAIPSQDAFRSWPPKELIERPYWLPWEWVSFQRAQLFDRPVLFLLTVGWNRFAQRMDAETLADPEVLRTLNEGYACIRVDADRRPDVRERYQTGSWPAIAFLLPNGKPILSPANPTGKPAPITAGFVNATEMLFLLREGRTYYERWSDMLRGAGERWAKMEGEAKPQDGPVNEAASDQMARWLLANADQENGGYGVAPKFVIPGLVEYGRIREARRAPDVAEHARITLEKMIASPLCDHREGGIHRIAAAASWGRVQYEKMLDGNTSFVRDLVFAIRAEDSPALRTALKETCRFMTTVLARPGGGFYLAQVADASTPDGGAYWNAAPGEASKPPVEPLVLAGENALAGAALLRAGALLDDPAAEAAGRAALDLVLARSYKPGRGVDHVVEPDPEQRRFLSTQSDVAFALLDAYESTGAGGYLRAARDVVDFALNNLLAPTEKTLRDHLPELGDMGILGNPRHPLSDNARMARALIRLSAHGLGDAYRDRALAILGAYAGDLALYGVHGVEPALAVEELLVEPVRIRINGPPEAPATRELRRAALSLAQPWVVVDTVPDGEKRRPVAVVRWRGASANVERPEKLAQEVDRLAAVPSPEGS